MSDDPSNVNPIFNAWVRAQAQMFEAQAPFWKQMSESMAPLGGEDLTVAAEKFWTDARKRGEDWYARVAAQTGFTAGGEGIAQETLKRMMDPGQFLYAGSDEINQTIQKLVEGPEFADIGTLERQGLKATKEWLALREASAEYRMVTGKAWARAFDRYTKAMAKNPEQWKEGPNAVMRRWLDIANDELIATQRTDAFLNVQRKLLRAGVEYRIRERELVEVWCELHSIPTRTEIDDLHGYVHGMRREVRDLRKTVDALRAPAAKKARKKPAPVKEN
ncbi:MAG: hypothetical protein KJO67_13835 [Silicimonas sp.]|nr:hypothetical protein [Silicimonas sp.]